MGLFGKSNKNGAKPEGSAKDSSSKPGASKPKRASATKPGEYGIEETIALMRDLPRENVELVLQVVTKTLESLNVEVSAILQDAGQKQSKIQAKIRDLEKEIRSFEQQITTRRSERSSTTPK